MMQPCNFCNKCFNKIYFNQRFCSNKCRNLFWQNETRKNNWRPIHTKSRKCIVCKKSFQPIRKTNIYCSNKCSAKIHPPPPSRPKTKYWTNRKWIEKNYLGKQISINNVCQKFNLERNTFYRWLKRLNIKSLPKSIVQKGEKNPFYGKNHTDKTKKKLRGPRPEFSGPNNHGWKGGIIPYYGPNWHWQGEKAHIRDNHTCQTCKKYQIKPKLPVHHIIPFRKFGLEKYKEANQLSNLITLCIPCHLEREATL